LNTRLKGAVEKVFFNHKARPAEAVRTGTQRRHKVHKGKNLYFSTL